MTGNLEGHFDTGPIKHTLLLGVDFTRSDLPWTFANNGAFGAFPTNAGTINLFNPVHDDPAFMPLGSIDSGSSDDFDERLGLYF